MEKLTYSITEAAEAVGVHPLTLRAAVKRGEIQHVRIGKRVLIPVVALRSFLEGRKLAGEAS